MYLTTKTQVIMPVINSDFLRKHIGHYPFLKKLNYVSLSGRPPGKLTISRWCIYWKNYNKNTDTFLFYSKGQLINQFMNKLITPVP